MGCTLSDLTDGLGCSYDFVNNLIRRDVLTTKVQRSKPGKARTFSRQNALEIGFLSILSGVGFGPTEASQQAQFWLEAEAAGTLREWSIRNPNVPGTWDPRPTMFGDFESLTLETLANIFSDSKEPYLLYGQDAKKSASALIIVRPGEIVRRVDELFGQETADDKARATR
jgi:hypothetical protein